MSMRGKSKDSLSRLAKALTVIAYENDLTFNDGVYVAANGERYVATRLGFVPAEQENIRIINAKLRNMVDELELEKKSMAKTIKDYFLYERELDTKAFIKIVRILRSRVSSDEKVFQIRKYLNIDGDKD